VKISKNKRKTNKLKFKTMIKTNYRSNKETTYPWLMLKLIMIYKENLFKPTKILEKGPFQDQWCQLQPTKVLTIISDSISKIVAVAAHFTLAEITNYHQLLVCRICLNPKEVLV